MNKKNKEPWELFREEISEQEIQEAYKEMCAKRTSKKPAHEVVVDIIRETIESLNDQSEPKIEMESVPILLKVGILSALLEVLKRMVIPEKHFGKVFDSLRKIKQNCPAEYAEKLLPEKFFPILIMSQPEPKTEQ